jgi:hypothetical protein
LFDRFDAASSAERKALAQAATRAEVKALVARLPPNEWLSDPEWLALLKSKRIKVHLTINEDKVAVIRGGHTKHGTGRRWGKSQWIQRSFLDENVLGYPLPPKVNLGELTNRVNAWLKQQEPGYSHGPVTRWAVKDALAQARAASAGKPAPKRKK